MVLGHAQVSGPLLWTVWNGYRAQVPQQQIKNITYIIVLVFFFSHFFISQSVFPRIINIQQFI